MGCSNVVTGVVNFLMLMLLLPIIGFGVWLAKKHDSECVRFLQWPVIVLGMFVLVVSMAGLFGSWCGNRPLMWTYLFVMFVLIFLLFVLTLLAFVVTNSGAGRVVSGKGFKEYKLGDYSNWLQKRVDNPLYWSKIKSCLADGQVCSDLSQYATADVFNNASLTPVESGCCKPKSDCGYTFQNATTWLGNSSGSANADCRAWSNTQTQLCFDCNSCRAGVLQNVKSNWRRVAVVNIIVLVFIIFVYSCGCCALKSSKREQDNFKYRE
ncbi:tetraspanin-8 isoform X2 [Physcomitrium patens]|uniref:tetraspanin-8 isoform X2 n=1 Tax=Physcomitrium patens TaxID=3218 RepID=UPI00024AD98C